MVKQSKFVLCLLLLPTVLALANFPDHVEYLNYDPDSSGTGRVKRSFDWWPFGAAKPRPVGRTVRFTAFNRSFALILRPISPGVAPFTKDLSVYLDGVIRDVQPQHFLYEGYIEGDDNSQVYGSLFDGVFDGHIRLSGGKSYTVERTSKYEPNKIILGIIELRHSFIYDDQDFKLEVFSSPTAIDEDSRTENAHIRGRWQREFSSGRNSLNLSAVRSCSMHLQVDQTLFADVFKMEGRKDELRTLDEIVSMLYVNMRAVNGIYMGTEFNGIQGIHFTAQRISVFTPQSCSNHNSIGRAQHRFCEVTSDAEQFIRAFAAKDHTAFCLSYAFTHTKFEENVLGIAQRAATQTDGVCGSYKVNFSGRWILQSHNAGAVTLYRQHGWTRALPYQVQLVLAHELGHSLGAEHDSGNEEESPEGYYLMKPHTSDGTMPNHRKFSPQSIASIGANLESMLSNEPFDPLVAQAPAGSRRNCFQCE